MLNQTIIKPGYKKVPHIGEIPENWESKELSELCTVNKGEQLNKSDLIIEGDYPSYSGGTSPSGFTNKWNTLENTITISEGGNSCGYINFLKTKFWCGGHCYAIKDIKLDKVYLYQILKFGERRIMRLRVGSGLPNIQKKDLLKFHLQYPKNILEQQKIAEILKTSDTQIELIKKIIQKVELRNKGLQQQLLTGKKRLDGFSGEWNELHIGDFSKEISKKNKEDKDLTVLSCTKYNGLVPSLEYFGRKIYSDNLTTYKIVPNNTFAYATNHIEEGSIGYQANLEEALISPMYTVFETNSSINNFYLFKLLKTSHLIYEYQRRMEGSIDRRGGLRWKDFSKIKINIPGIDEQNAIVLVLNKAAEQLDSYKQKLEKLESEKKGLMQQLLTGKTRVKI